MSGTKDAKYFGARIGENCWYNSEEFLIDSVSMSPIKHHTKFVVILSKQRGLCAEAKTSWDGEGITFTAPRKMVEKSLDCLVNYYSDNDFFVQCTTGDKCRVNGVRPRNIVAKLTWQEEE